MTEKETAAKERNSKASLWKTWYRPNVEIHKIWKAKKRKGKRKGIDALGRMVYVRSLTEGRLALYAFLSERLHDRRPVHMGQDLGSREVDLQVSIVPRE
jgi:hypothetical protein